MEKPEIFLDYYCSFNEDENCYSLGFGLRGELEKLDEDTIPSIDIMIFGVDYKIDPISSNFVACDGGYKSRQEFHLHPEKKGEKSDNVSVRLLVRGEPVYRNTISLSDLVKK
jgi:hypothetical protein